MRAPAFFFGSVLLSAIVVVGACGDELDVGETPALGDAASDSPPAVPNVEGGGESPDGPNPNLSCRDRPLAFGSATEIALDPPPEPNQGVLHPFAFQEGQFVIEREQSGANNLVSLIIAKPKDIGPGLTIESFPATNLTRDAFPTTNSIGSEVYFTQRGGGGGGVRIQRVVRGQVNGGWLAPQNAFGNAVDPALFPSLTGDSLVIVFGATTIAGEDLRVVQMTRTSLTDPWDGGATVLPSNAAEPIEFPSISPDGLGLFFRRGTATLYATRTSRTMAFSAATARLAEIRRNDNTRPFIVRSISTDECTIYFTLFNNQRQSPRLFRAQRD